MPPPVMYAVAAVVVYMIGWLIGRKQGYDEAALIREAKIDVAYKLGRCAGMVEAYRALGVEPPADYD